MAVVIGQINFKDDLKLNLFRKGPKKIYVNESILKKQSEIKNYIRSVCFCSNDIDIVRSEPSYRRRWIDKVVSQLEPVYLDLISRFNRLLKQRSHFWRSKNFSKNQSSDILESFDAAAKIKVLKVVRNATGLGLGDAKALVESAPKTVKEGIAKADAESIKKEIEEAGGKVTLK